MLISFRCLFFCSERMHTEITLEKEIKTEYFHCKKTSIILFLVAIYNIIFYAKALLHYFSEHYFCMY